MKILSSVYWHVGLHNNTNPNSVLLKLAEKKRENLVFALVCDGAVTKEYGLTRTEAVSDAGEIASGYVVEEMAKWFELHYLYILLKKKSVRWIKRKIMSELSRIKADLDCYGEKKGINIDISFVLFVSMSKRYAIIHFGETEAYRFGRFAGCRRVMGFEGGFGEGERERAEGRRGGKDNDRPSQSIKWKTGKTKRGQGFLLCSSDYLLGLSKQKMKEVLKPSELRSEQQIRKRLSGIADYNKSFGESAAVYIKFY